MPTASASFIIHFARVSNLAVHHNVGTCLRHVSMQSAIVSTPWKHAEGMSLRHGAVIFGDLTHPLLCLIDGGWCRALPLGARVCGGQGFCSPHDCVPLASPHASRLPLVWWLMPFWWWLALQ